MILIQAFFYKEKWRKWSFTEKKLIIISIAFSVKLRSLRFSLLKMFKLTHEVH